MHSCGESRVAHERDISRRIASNFADFQGNFSVNFQGWCLSRFDITLSHFSNDK